MKRPMTTAELFDRICEILKEKGRMPEILNYSLGAYHPEKITNYMFELRSNLDYGGSEGIYLDLWLDCFEDGEYRKKELGTFKTLRDDYEAMKLMGLLLVVFIVEEHAYVNANLDDFTWEGADVFAYDENGKRLGWGYSCCSMEAAVRRKDELLKRCPRVVIRDNATRKEETFEGIFAEKSCL